MKNLETVKSIEEVKRIILIVMLILFIICIVIYFCGKVRGAFKSDIVDDIKKTSINEPLIPKAEMSNMDAKSYPGMPFIAIKLDKHKIIALINTGA